jgi:hypothetical protein
VFKNLENVVTIKFNLGINMENKEAHISAVVNNQDSEAIIKKIRFKKETLRNLVTIASREYYDSKLKQDEILSQMLDQIINSYYEEYWKK